MKVNVYATFQDHRSNGSAGRVHTDRRTDRQTDGTQNITSSANAGGNERMLPNILSPATQLIIISYGLGSGSVHVPVQYNISCNEFLCVWALLA